MARGTESPEPTSADLLGGRDGVEQLAAFAALEVWIFTATLGLVVGYWLLTGRIHTAGLLRDEANRLSPMRLQLLIVTLLAAGAHLAGVAEALEAGWYTLPGVSVEVLYLFGASSAASLARKAYLRFS